MADNLIQKPSFEEVGFTGYDVFCSNPPDSTWNFTASSGLVKRQSSFWNDTSPDPTGGGNQQAWLKNTGSISQTFSVTSDQAGPQTLTFQTRNRNNGHPEVLDYQVLIDNTPIGSVTPAGFTWETKTITGFSLTAGTHTLKFLGLNTVLAGENAALLDTINLTLDDTVTAPTTGGVGLSAAGISQVTAIVRAEIASVLTVARLGGIDKLQAARVAADVTAIAGDTAVPTILADDLHGDLVDVGQAVWTHGTRTVSAFPFAVTLSTSGLDQIMVEEGINMRQAMVAVLANAAGKKLGPGAKTGNGPFTILSPAGIVRVNGVMENDELIESTLHLPN